ncbi:hypothetical protein [Actinacidiphila yeochonensis]|uniref:hypothetical protein n=1 Tax=Actinacidiphila yeochonensis TaxID=89050 RepID=UPI0012FECE77|nr:hypothetical protein [Actinacidiphila yeochonensis]
MTSFASLGLSAFVRGSTSMDRRARGPVNAPCDPAPAAISVSGGTSAITRPSLIEEVRRLGVSGLLRDGGMDGGYLTTRYRISRTVRIDPVRADPE